MALPARGRQEDGPGSSQQPKRGRGVSGRRVDVEVRAQFLRHLGLVASPSEGDGVKTRGAARTGCPGVQGRPPLAPPPDRRRAIRRCEARCRSSRPHRGVDRLSTGDSASGMAARPRASAIISSAYPPSTVTPGTTAFSQFTMSPRLHDSQTQSSRRSGRRPRAARIFHRDTNLRPGRPPDLSLRARERAAASARDITRDHGPHRCGKIPHASTRIRT